MNKKLLGSLIGLLIGIPVGGLSYISVAYNDSGSSHNFEGLIFFILAVSIFVAVGWHEGKHFSK